MTLCSSLLCAAVLLLTSRDAFGVVKDAKASLERELLLKPTKPRVAEGHLRYFLTHIAATTAGETQTKPSPAAPTNSTNSTGGTSSVASVKIVRGVDADPLKYRSFARLTIDKHGELDYNCGGVLISDRFVLTAAHCVWNMENGGLEPGGLRHDAYGAAVGLVCDEPDNCGYPFVSFRATHYWVHPEWDVVKFVLDIALVRLQGRVPSSVAEPVVPDLGNHFNSLTIGYVNGLRSVGYGWINDAEIVPTKLQEVLVGYLPADRCERYWGRLYDGVICVYTNDAVAGLFGRGLCKGDSGSPTIIPRDDGPDVVIGVTSFGWVPCTAKDRPDVLARVSAGAKYIANVVCYPQMSDYSPEWCREFGWKTGFQGGFSRFDINPFTPDGRSWFNLGGIVEPENEVPQEMTECGEVYDTLYKPNATKPKEKKCRKLENKPVERQQELCAVYDTTSNAGVQCCDSCLKFLSEQRREKAFLL